MTSKHYQRFRLSSVDGHLELRLKRDESTGETKAELVALSADASEERPIGPVKIQDLAELSAWLSAARLHVKVSYDQEVERLLFATAAAADMLPYELMTRLREAFLIGLREPTTWERAWVEQFVGPYLRTTIDDILDATP